MKKIKKQTPTINQQMEQSVSLMYQINNSLMDARAKYKKCIEQNASKATVTFFEGQVDAWESIRKDTIENYKISVIKEDESFKNAIELSRNNFWEEFIKVYPNEKDKQFDDYFLDNGDCLHNEFSDYVIKFSEKVLLNNQTEVPKIMMLFYDYSKVNSEYNYIKDYKNIIYSLCEKIRWDNYNDYIVEKKVYEIPIDLVVQLKNKSDLLKKNINYSIQVQNIELAKCQKLERKLSSSKHEVPSDLTKRINVLENAIKTNTFAKQNYKNLETQVDIIYNRYLNCEKRYKIDTFTNAILGANKLLLKVFTSDNVSEYKQTFAKPRENIFVSKREIEDVLLFGSTYYDMLTVSCKLAKLIDMPIKIPKELADYSINCINFITDINVETVNNVVNKISEKTNIPVSEVIEKLTDEEIDRIVLPSEELKYLHFETNNGTFFFDGEYVIDVNKNVSYDFNSDEDLIKLFGINEKDFEDESNFDLYNNM